MASTLGPSRTATRILASRAGLGNASRRAWQPANRRHFFGLFKKAKAEPKAPPPVLAQDDLFHPFSKSPFPYFKERGEAISKLAPCPVCAESYKTTKVIPHAVKFECPDCGWPTHCSGEHWEADEEHAKYCSRLREVNEDDHDLRSGRRIREFEMPGPQAYEEAVSFANWDTLWYTRGFPSMDTERSRRHASKLLTYPLTIGSVLHQHSPLTLNNQRLTSEGSRSLAALRTTLHVDPGCPDTEEAGAGKSQMRIFILGARHESALPPHVWEQLCMLFPSCHFHLYFIGPQVSLPKPPKTSPDAPAPTAASPPPPPTEETSKEPEPPKSQYLPNIYEPPTPAPIARLKRTRSSVQKYGVPSYTVPYTPQLTITGMQANYMDVHAQFEGSFDPYNDLFFFFSPGFGFPSPVSVSPTTGEPLLQLESPTEWGSVLPTLLQSRCPIFVTGFSPADVERDVKALGVAEDVANEFEWVITPGANAFGCEKWEVADFDPRVMVKTNWGVWGIRGKGREVREQSGFSFSL
ncbi:hypothetical protein FIBSPDRAFT_1042788 [Athelia psychrophila]|uniref:Uncharacterized protein n=1 Tax=Athelia psychrophila TaxID=1759441 RepID=A0A166M4D3_9AGAM|nr:hypothetical protein FIBSPDRAFT_1042788 [Fibularhizoctonia sp. CBS 109695]